MTSRGRFLHSLPDWLFTPGSQRLVRFAIISAVFVLSLLLAVRNNQQLMFIALLLVIAAAGAIILIRRLPLGLLLLIFTALLVPSPFQSGAAANFIPPMILVALLLGLWVVDMVARQRQIKLARSRTMLPAAIFLIATFISFFNGQINYYSFTQNAPLSAQIGELAVFLFSFGAFILVANLINEVKWLERMTWLFLGLGGVYMFARLLPVTDDIIRPLYQYGSDASLFWTWMVAMTGSQALLNSSLSKRIRYILFALLAVSLYVALVQAYSWKSGWIPALAGLFVIVWLAKPRYRVALIVFAGLALVLNSFVQVEQVVTGGEDYSILTRLEAWRIILEIVKVNPLLGLGLSNYYWYTQLFPILGYAVKFNSHNNYVDIIAQVGLIGLACFLWFLWEAGRLGWELRHEAKEGFQYAFVIGVLGGLAGTVVAGMLGDWILPFVYNVGVHGYRSSIFFWLFLGGLVALEQIIRHPKTAAPVD